MTVHVGNLYLALIVSVLLSCFVAWIIARSYRRRMWQLMRAPHTAQPAAPVADSAPDGTLPLAVSLADNHRAGMRLCVLLIALSCLMAVTSASIWHALQFPDEPLLPKRIAVMALLHMWPMIPALALIWRWSRRRLFGMLLLWGVVFFVVALWRSIDAEPLRMLVLMAVECGLALALVSLVFLGNAHVQSHRGCSCRPRCWCRPCSSVSMR